MKISEFEVIFYQHQYLLKAADIGHNYSIDNYNLL